MRRRCFWCVSARACNGELRGARLGGAATCREVAAPVCLDLEKAMANGRDLVWLCYLAPVQQILHPLNKISLSGKATKKGLPSH